MFSHVFKKGTLTSNTPLGPPEVNSGLFYVAASHAKGMSCIVYLLSTNTHKKALRQSIVRLFLLYGHKLCVFLRISFRRHGRFRSILMHLLTLMNKILRHCTAIGLRNLQTYALFMIDKYRPHQI